MADQLWLMTRIREEEEVLFLVLNSSSQQQTKPATCRPAYECMLTWHIISYHYCSAADKQIMVNNVNRCAPNVPQ